MKATELRIGNVYNSVKFRTAVECELTDLAELCHRSDGAYNDPPIDEMFEPIPLTELWLLRFGFEKWGNEPFTPHENHLIYCLSNAIDGTSDFKVYLSESWYGAKELTPEEILKHTEKHWGIKIDYDILYFYYELKYVHQLQNLYFSLTGEELIIT